MVDFPFFTAAISAPPATDRQPRQFGQYDRAVRLPTTILVRPGRLGRRRSPPERAMSACDIGSADGGTTCWRLRYVVATRSAAGASSGNASRIVAVIGSSKTRPMVHEQCSHVNVTTASVSISTPSPVAPVVNV